MDHLLLIIRLILFAVFVLAGVGKLLDLKGSKEAVKDFGVPETFVRPIGILLPFAETVVAFCFLFLTTSWLGAIGGLIILLMFIAGMLVQMQKGNAPDCHCFGQFHSEPVGAKSLIRNCVIAGLAALLVFAGSGGQGTPLGSTVEETIQGIVLAILGVFAVGAALYVRELRSQLREIARRADIQEIMEDGRTVNRADAGALEDSLPIGAQFPDFQLTDTSGRIVTFEHLLADYKPKIFFFVGPKCEPCKAMIPTFLEWRREFEGRIRFVFVSSGSAADNAERFGDDIATGMLLQKKKELANRVYAKWTPSAMFVSADGSIASHVATGDGSIIDMIDKIRSEDFTAAGFNHQNPGKPGRIRIGFNVPEFEIKDLSGQTIGQEFFKGRQTLALFLTTTCTFCAEVVEQLRRLEASGENGFGVVIFSDGDRSVHEDFAVKAPILLEKDYVTATKMGMFGAPSGVLVDENGIIISETAVGNAAIWSLVGKFD